ncbi:hypothetical protein HYDPIDRAFT_31686 [Hydnomerulius pinastri MD-312]|uniref:NACHT domain-containing protein n=1 Tax=Hydnomerulius pinastri MD-312 TaxID=994086 RepID=A0A0C9VSV2_9AGAM|nr:hypothetical protein HYDPIDRAFT_31686 [Hydnomerulius pinastri MD-312]
MDGRFIIKASGVVSTLDVYPAFEFTLLPLGIEIRNQARDRVVPRRFSVNFSVGDVLQSTGDAKEKKKRATWVDTLFFYGEDTSILEIGLYQKHSCLPDEYVGGFKGTVRALSERTADGVIEEVLDKTTAGGRVAPTGITIKFVLSMEKRAGTAGVEDLRAEDAQTRANVAVQELGPTPQAVGLATGAVDTIGNVTVEAQTVENTWGVLLDRIKLFTQIVDGIVEIHPYVSLAWSVLSAANKVIINQQGRDDRIVRLAGTMNNAFAFVHDAEPLKAIKAHLKVITLLVQQATECGYFIAEYAKENSFLTRTMRYAFSDIDARITEYENKLVELKNAFLQGVAVHSAVTVFRIMNQVQDITTAIDLNDMPYAAGARYTEERGCLAGTRETFISEICDIINNPADDAPRVCLLTGVAGSGKSAIAHTVARLYDQQHRLGSSYCFDTSHAATRHAGNFFSTIARDLSDHDPQYKECLWEVVKDNRSLRTSTSPVQQVEFITRASEHLDVIGPILVVVDALDESGDRTARRNLLSALSKQITESKLPANLRLLITARPESDILEMLSSSQVAHKRLDEVNAIMVDADIAKFVKDSLRGYHKLDLRWRDQEWCRLLVHHSQHLFQWASTACNFIKGEGFEGLDPCEQLELLLQPTGGESPHPLDALYRTILSRLFGARALAHFRKVMGVVFALNEPLSLLALAEMFHGEVDLELIIKPMGSLLAGVANQHNPVQPLHTSFRDFLLDGDRSLVFHVSITSQHQHVIGLASIACMQRMLKFNMCNLEDSSVLNSEVDGLQERVKAAIPSYLAYSCQYWMEHLHCVECSQDVLGQVTDFFKTCFPYWLEASSLLSQLVPTMYISSAQKSCVLLQKWAKVNRVC